MAEPLFRGVGVALVTLFDDNGELDVEGTATLARTLVDEGVQGVLVAGTTGEADTLDDDERMRLVAGVKSALGDVVPVLAGTGAAWGGHAAIRTWRAFDAGADAVLALSPRRVADPRPYYRTVADAAGGRPLLAYHLPAVSPPGIPVEVLPDLPVVGCKDSSGEPERLLQTVRDWSRAVYVGSSAILSFAGPLGVQGAILAVANVEPGLAVEAFSGDPQAQRRLTDTHLATAADFPHGIKRLVADRFGTSTTARAGE